VAVVTYARTVQVALPPTSVSRRADIARVIDRLSASGSTAGHDGLSLAYDQAEAAYVEGGINHILLLTDGDFNLGPYSDAEMLTLVERRREGGVTFTALGFGLGNLNDAMMEKISNAGNGIYRVISGDKTARRYAEQRLLSDVVHIAKDVKIQVEMNPELVYAWRQIGYENRQLADAEFRDDTVDAGEIGSGHQMTALYELALRPEALPDVTGAPMMEDGEAVPGRREIQPGELVQVRLRYKAPGATRTDPAEEMRVGLRDPSQSPTLGAESRFAWSVSTLAGRLRGDPYQTPARLEAARRALDAVRRPERADFRRLFDRARALLR
jgi:Ca-activated chloride channel family protein